MSHDLNYRNQVQTVFFLCKFSKYMIYTNSICQSWYTLPSLWTGHGPKYRMGTGTGWVTDLMWLEWVGSGHKNVSPWHLYEQSIAYCVSYKSLSWNMFSPNLFNKSWTHLITSHNKLYWKYASKILENAFHLKNTTTRKTSKQPVSDNRLLSVNLIKKPKPAVFNANVKLSITDSLFGNFWLRSNHRQTSTLCLLRRAL